jgi:hypothetical protein
MRIITFLIITLLLIPEASFATARQDAIERQQERDRAVLQREEDKVRYLKKISDSQSVYADAMLKIVQEQQEQNRILELVLSELKELNSKNIIGRK